MLRQGELVSVQTSDLIRLHGYFLPAQLAAATSIDAVLITHAVAGNYYNSRFLNRLALGCHDLGIPVLLGNNRGHDVVNYLSQGAARCKAGAAFETVADCRYDLSAWADLLQERGFRRIALLGHSLGAIKSIYSQVRQPHPGVVAIIAFSASRLSHEDFVASPHADRYWYWLNQAQERVAAGDGQHLMDVDFPFPVLISAATYLDKYDQNSRYNWIPLVRDIELPTWLAFGERELQDNAAFQGILPQVEALNNPALQIEVVPRANHYYAGCQQVATELMQSWLRCRFPQID